MKTPPEDLKGMDLDPRLRVPLIPATRSPEEEEQLLQEGLSIERDQLQQIEEEMDPSSFEDMEERDKKIKEIEELEKYPVKTTFKIDETVALDFTGVCEEIGFRRDRYLNKILPIAIELFEGSPKRNSPDAEIVSKVLREASKPKVKKFVVTLDNGVVEEMNEVCTDKRVSRDVFFQEVLRCLIHGSGIGYRDQAFVQWIEERTKGVNEERTLEDVTSNLYDPWNGWKSYDYKKKEDLLQDEIAYILSGPEEDLTDEDWEAYVGAITSEMGPLDNHSPFDGVLIGDVPMDTVQTAMKDAIEGLKGAKES